MNREIRRSNQNNPPRLAILQRVCPNYRTALFAHLTINDSFYTKLFIGDDIPDSKVKSTASLEGIRFHKLKTYFFKLGKRILPWHVNLVKELRRFNPDVILCEGESHFIGYLQAFWYRIFYNRKVALIHWCFISLPGEPLYSPGIANWIKSFTRKYFDAFLLYSSYSKNSLLDLGVASDKTFVATNVGDVEKFLKASHSLENSPMSARQKLKLPDKFTVLYTGTLDKNKRPGLIIELAMRCDPSKFNFVLLGSGELLNELRQKVEQENLFNVFLPGRITEELYLYYRAGDVLVIPGRGGIIISEAMAFGIPVITHQADGTEYDLVRDNDSGFLLKEGNTENFYNAINFLQQNPGRAKAMGDFGRQLIAQHFTTENMVKQIISAARYAINKRR